MDTTEKQVIEELFGKIRHVEAESAPRDADAEAYIKNQIARQPAAPYYMAQTIVIQEQALGAAQARIEELETELASKPAGGGRLLGGLFGGGEPARPRAGRAGPRTAAGADPRSVQHADPRQRQGGGFLAGAAQTAMGVAGGVLLANAIGGMFAGGEAEAAEPADEGGFDEGGFDDGGSDFEF